MKLRSLHLHGFKSFADRTELRFHDGITAIVGPNGCGKSNISDAIRWVLGEQRASAIRGAKMEEAIFQGTQERRALNRAEVALGFSNEDGRLAVAFDEVEVRRILFREGGSEYQLNRNPCRLRDIHDLLRDTGLGANSYAVIEQRMVDAILSDRTDDRRQIFEEAAGVGRYKDRRKGAQRRLEAAEADLARLEDLIGEVESKVRSLARQRGKAQRFQQMRERRLALEITLAADQVGALVSLLEETKERLAALAQDEPARRAALASAEAELERRKLESGEIARTRSATAARLEDVGRRIAERDRELAVADERRAHAERRLAQISIEREEVHARIATLEEERRTLEQEREDQRARLEALTAQLEQVHEHQQALRARVAERRRADELARAREKELTRRMAEAEATAAGADARAAECAAQLARLEQEREDLRFEIEQVTAQGDLFAEQVRDVAARLAAAEEARDVSAETLASLRAREAAIRQALVEAEDRANLLAAQLAALEAIERDYDGFLPQVQAALASRDQVNGLLGPLAEFLRVPPERAAQVEHTLGSLLQILVVRDTAAIDDVRRWLDSQRAGEGALALLPQDALPRLEAFLEAVTFAGEPPAEAILIGRRERIAALKAEAARAAEIRDDRARERAEVSDRIAELEEELREREAMLQTLAFELQRAKTDEAARTGQHEKLLRVRDEMERRFQQLEAAGEEARQTAAAARAEQARLEEELHGLRASWQADEDEIARLEAEWETVRDEESELRVVHARAESGLAELERRIAAAIAGAENSRMRLESLGREEAEHRQTLEQMQDLRIEAGATLQDLFTERDELSGQIRVLDERLAEAAEAADALEAQVRSLRRSGEETAEERHRLEIRRTEAESELRAMRERIAAEWGRPLEQLLQEVERVEGEPDALRAELNALMADIERLGPINMLAVEEHEEESRRLEFLTSQRDDLVRAKNDLQTAIREINRTAKELFLETFEQIRANFRRTFETLFEGGTCDIWLTDPDDPLESDIEISASPRGKRTQRIHLLSGGERALTSLALLFAVYLVKPSPFCVLDEVDAPLDEANVGRFISMIQEFKAETQFIVITHNPRTMEAADWIYGVTMQEPGVSSIVGVRLEEALATIGEASA